MPEEALTPFEKNLQAFSTSSDLAHAMEIVRSHVSCETDNDGRGMYQHYTTLGRVIEKILTKRWYLTRGDSPKLNDHKESVKYGCDQPALIRKTYIMCLGKGAGENAAMWGLYANNDPLAMRISIPRKTVDEWMRGLMNGNGLDVDDKRRQVINSEQIDEVVFHDMIYVAVKDKDVLDDIDIRRTNTISWEGATKHFGNKYSLSTEVRKGKFAGWLKDYEWKHERESRLCIRLKQEIKDAAISISIPRNVIAEMRFTFSPWLEDEGVRASIQSTIRVALESGGVRLGKHPQHFRRSVLQGALNFPS